MSRPRDEKIPTVTQLCKKAPTEHGGQETEHRRHRQGFYGDGRVRYVWTCMPCHLKRNLARYHQARKSEETA